MGTEKTMEPHDYKVTKIEGEYATLTDINTGDELFIALFLLPDGIDIDRKSTRLNSSQTLCDRKSVV